MGFRVELQFSEDNTLDLIHAVERATAAAAYPPSSGGSGDRGMVWTVPTFAKAQWMRVVLNGAGFEHVTIREE